MNAPANANPDTNVSKPTTPDMGEATEVIEPVSLMSLIEGEITLHNDAVTTSDANISVRNTNVSEVMSANGKFALELPQADTEQIVILDISGTNVVPDSVSVPVPANTVCVKVSADIALRSPPISVNLGNGRDDEPA